jgi:uncharacterized protein
MPTYQAPGVYVEEISTLPPSVAEVSTAIPAFIGVTKKVPDGKLMTPVRIDSLLEYVDLFGTADNYLYQFDVTKDANNAVTSVKNTTSTTNPSTYNLFYALRMFYDNGGGSCWVVSLGTQTVGDWNTYQKALDLLDGIDEPTLLVAPHAAIDLTAGYNDLCQQMLSHAATLKDRFAILDLPRADTKTLSGTVVTSFRLIANNLAYGAAYMPFLKTSMAYIYDESSSVTVKIISANQTPDAEGLTNAESSVAVSFDDFTVGGEKELTIPLNLQFDPTINNNPAVLAPSGNISTDFKLEGTVKSYDKMSGKIIITVTKKEGTLTGTPANRKYKINVAVKTLAPGGTYVSLSSIASVDTGAYQAVKSFLKNTPTTVVAPPSSAIAGVYARVDRERGVWKAPANVGVASIIGPIRNIDNTEQNDLNVDPTGGKSINVIRSFAGRGTMVWGARTLAGNDNEWRYVPVRRLFITIEESILKATAFAVFEPNDVSTWLKVKAMIESYLFGLWQQGALAGPTSEGAYFVNVGLGKTMNTDDILNGRMIVEVGIAAVRPAEFIILRFSHKLQTA